MKKTLLSLALMAALMLPFAADAQYFFDFEGGAVPSGWTVTGTDPYWTVGGPVTAGYPSTTYSPHGGNFMAYLGAQYGDAESLLTSPALDLSVSVSNVVRFWYLNAAAIYFGFQSGLNSMTVECTADGTHWIALGTYNTHVTTWTEVVYTIPDSLMTDQFQLRFRGLHQEGACLAIDDLQIGDTPSCLPVTNLHVVSAGMNSIEVEWTDPNSISWEYAYATQPITDWSSQTTQFAFSNPFIISGLTAGTNYHIYVRPDCDATTQWSEILAHTMLCNDPCEIELVAGNNPIVNPNIWADCSVEVVQGGLTLATVTGTSGTYPVSVCPNVPIVFNFNDFYSYGNYCTLTVNDAFGHELYHSDDLDYLGQAFFTCTTDCQAPTCDAPRQLRVGVRPDGATLTWQDSLATAWTVAWSTTPFAPGSGTQNSANVNVTAFTLSNLTPQTTYYAAVAALCADTTIWSNLVEFTTPCSYLTALPWTIDFEGLAPAWQNNALGLPQCWEIYQNYNNVNPCPFGGYAHSGQVCVSLHSIGTGSGNHFALPPFDDLTGLYFGYYGIMQSAYPATVFSIGVISDSTGEYIPMDTIVMDDKYQYYQVDLTPYAQYGHRVAVYARRDTADGMMHIYMDDFIIDRLNPCPNVGNLVGEGLTTTTARLEWEVMGSSTGAYTIEYGPEGFLLGTGTRVVANNNPFTLTGLQASTSYDFYVRANCTSGQQGNWSWFPGHFATACGVFDVSHYEPLFESFESTNTIVPNCWSVDFYGSNGPDINTESTVHGSQCFQMGRATSTYLISPELHTFGDMALSFHYRSRNAYPVEMLAVGYSLSSSDPSDSTWVWLSSEMVTNTAWERRVDSIPMAARWVAIHSLGVANTDIFVDSILLATTAMGCSTPRNLAVQERTASSATVAWTGAGDDYDIELRSGATWTGNALTVSTTSHRFTTLNPATTYYYRVRQVCDAGNHSEWAYGEFTTDSVDQISCFAPTQLTVLEVSNNSATLVWTPGDEEQQWQVRYAAQGDTLMVSASETTVEITNLHNPADYTAWVRALCGPNGEVASEWSEPVVFSTVPCEPVDHIVVSNITSHGATVSWTSNGPAIQWKLNYGLAGHTLDEGVEIIVSEPTCTISGLQWVSTAYDVQVQAICGEGWVSDFVTSDPFTTLASIDQVDLSGISLYPNPATTEVTIEGYEGEVVLVYVTGRVVLTTTKSTIDVRDLAKGAYFVKLGNEVRKLIVK